MLQREPSHGLAARALIQLSCWNFWYSSQGCSSIKQAGLVVRNWSSGGFAMVAKLGSNFRRGYMGTAFGYRQVALCFFVRRFANLGLATLCWQNMHLIMAIAYMVWYQSSTRWCITNLTSTLLWVRTDLRSTQRPSTLVCVRASSVVFRGTAGGFHIAILKEESCLLGKWKPSLRLIDLWKTVASDDWCSFGQKKASARRVVPTFRKIDPNNPKIIILQILSGSSWIWRWFVWFQVS